MEEEVQATPWATYAHKLDKRAREFIDWQRPRHMIWIADSRLTNPWPLAHARWQGQAG